MSFVSGDPISSVFSSFMGPVAFGVVGLVGLGVGFYFMDRYNKIKALGSELPIMALCKKDGLIKGEMVDVTGRCISFPIKIAKNQLLVDNKFTKTHAKQTSRVVMISPTMGHDVLYNRMKIAGANIDKVMYPMPGIWPMSIHGARALMDIVEDVIHGNKHYSMLLNDVKMIEIFFCDADDLEQTCREFIRTVYKAGVTNGLSLEEMFPGEWIPRRLNQPKEPTTNQSMLKELQEVEDSYTVVKETNEPETIEYDINADPITPVEEKKVNKKFSDKLKSKFKLGGK